ncbi:hypothetical protein B0H13DRAFT_2505429 [Mycena leptocephala]|nr:hypothetical protein B0H13DRAFT_2505429 [Mycena leptocephala]
MPVTPASSFPVYLWWVDFEVTGPLENVTWPLPRNFAGSISTKTVGSPNNTAFFWGFEKTLELFAPVPLLSISTCPLAQTCRIRRSGPATPLYMSNRLPPSTVESLRSRTDCPQTVDPTVAEQSTRLRPYP